MTIDLGRFQVPRGIHINFLEGKIEEWFLLPTSQKLAREEINRRRKEMIAVDKTSLTF
jgi:hypothetical protein